MKRFLFISMLSFYAFAMSSCAKEELESPAEIQSEYPGSNTGGNSYDSGSCSSSDSDGHGDPAEAPINDDGDDEEEGRGTTAAVE